MATAAALDASAAAAPAPAAFETPPAPAAGATAATPPPLFRPRPELAKSAPNTPPLIVPIVRAPDDPGIDEDPLADEYAEGVAPRSGQAGGWRGFLARWGG